MIIPDLEPYSSYSAPTWRVFKVLTHIWHLARLVLFIWNYKYDDSRWRDIELSNRKNIINFKFDFHINSPSYFIIVPGLVKTQFGDCIIYIYILQTVPEYNRSSLELTVLDTSHMIVLDTLHLTVLDTWHLTVLDISHLTLLDTSHLTLYYYLMHIRFLAIVGLDSKTRTTSKSSSSLYWL